MFRALRVRRALLCVPLILAASDCGFRPVYGDGGAQAGTVSAHLASVTVELIPDRQGQVLQQDLQARLDRPVSEGRRYTLRSSFSVTDDFIAIQQDSTITRVRMVGLANYTVRSLADGHTLTSGTARAVDGVDVVYEQYFEEDLQQDAAIRRLAQTLADQIALQLSSFFASHPNA